MHNLINGKNIYNPFKVVFSSAIISTLILLPLGPAEASHNTCTQQQIESTNGKVSITFDDGYERTYRTAARYMRRYGFKGTAYVYPEAQDNKLNNYMSWNQVKRLQDRFGWEIGAHTYSHVDATFGLTGLTLEQVREEFVRSNAAFASQGINIEAFASPYGDYNADTINLVKEYYSSHRTVWQLYNIWPYEDYILRTKDVSPTTTVAEVKSWIDEAIANDYWLIILFHDLTSGTAQVGNDNYNISDFRNIIKHLSSKCVSVKKVSEVVHSWEANPNIIANSSLEDGTPNEATNWLKSGPQVSILDQNRGVYPKIKRSAEIIGGPGQRQLYTQKTPVDDTASYNVKGYFKTTNYISGDVSVWISEYDSSGNYIGGKFLGGFNTSNFWFGNRYFSYTPQAGTKDIELYLIVHSGSNLTLEFDDIQMRKVI